MEQEGTGCGLKPSCEARFEPVVRAVEKMASDEEKRQILIAIDGKCGSGKTTLGYYLRQRFGGNLFHMDDFFLQNAQRTQERLAEVGGNVDYERFREEVLKPLAAGEIITYRPFDCKRREIVGAVQMKPERINIIEGSYSQHPYFGQPYDLKVFMEISKQDQYTNIERRNGTAQLEVFRTCWIPKEMAYFEKFEIKERSDMIISFTS